MKLRGQDGDQVDVRMSLDELVLLGNALHEICEGMQFSENDFQAILGVHKSEAEGLLMRIRSVLARLSLTAE